MDAKNKPTKRKGGIYSYFFKKQPVSIAAEQTESSACTKNDDDTFSEQISASSSDQLQSVNPIHEDSIAQTSKAILGEFSGEVSRSKNDIGLHVGGNVDDSTKCLLLENPWTPPLNYAFPYSIHGNRKRYLCKSHLDKYHWLVYSDIDKGLFCKYCALFSTGIAGHNKSMKLKRLVTEPLTSFKDLMGPNGDLQVHELHVYHKECVLTGKDFLRTYHSPGTEIINLLSNQRLQQIEENRARLRPVIQTIIMMGRQNIPFRGHRDDGPLLDESTSATNQGNFRALLKFRIDSGDTVLENHLKTASSRATYISKTTQNNLIKCCGEEITSSIIERVKIAKFYGVIFDETTDISHNEQLTLILRYYFNSSIREDFIQFLDAYRAIPNEEHLQCTKESESPDREVEPKLTGKALGQIVLKLLGNLSLDLNYCVGFGTDGCSVMTSEMCGAVTELMKSAKNACRCPCYNHALNNSISQSSKVPSIRNAVSNMKSAISFFNESAKRNLILKRHMGSNLTSLSETRWIERHDAVVKFYHGFPKIINALTEISNWSDSVSAPKAASLETLLLKTEFILSVASLLDILKITLPLSRILQTESLELMGASELITDTIATLENKRENSVNSFHTIYEEASNFASDHGIELRKPRITGRQTHRDNFITDSVEDYYKKSIYIPLLDHVILDIKSRFSQESLGCFDLRLLTPYLMLETRENLDTRLKSIITRYRSLLQEECVEITAQGEIDLWKTKWKREKEKGCLLPVSVLETLDRCDRDLFPTIRSLLEILATLPVTVASAERSFSSLRFIKIWLRSTMTEDRLNGLSLLFVHKDIDVDIENVIERYAKSGNRRFTLEFQL